MYLLLYLHTKNIQWRIRYTLRALVRSWSTVSCVDVKDQTIGTLHWTNSVSIKTDEKGRARSLLRNVM